jgi:hypothetical protein
VQLKEPMDKKVKKGYTQILRITMVQLMTSEGAWPDEEGEETPMIVFPEHIANHRNLGG